MLSHMVLKEQVVLRAGVSGEGTAGCHNCESESKGRILHGSLAGCMKGTWFSFALFPCYPGSGSLQIKCVLFRQFSS